MYVHIVVYYSVIYIYILTQLYIYIIISSHKPNNIYYISGY